MEVVFLMVSGAQAVSGDVLLFGVTLAFLAFITDATGMADARAERSVLESTFLVLLRTAWLGLLNNCCWWFLYGWDSSILIGAFA